MPNHEFLSVNDFLGTEMDARAIRSAMDLGILDALSGNGAMSLPTLAAERRINPIGLRLLIDLLEVNGVVARSGDGVELTPAFRAAFRFRDLLEMRIGFADLVWPDIHCLFTPLLTDLPQFMARSAVFNLFRYDRCIDVTPENLEATAAWTKFTTCLTKYEAAAALDGVDLASARSFIDLGGNTGEFALQVCRRNPNIEAVVVDLPVVCALGRKHVADAPEAARITFFPCDMRGHALPPAADLVAFKSVLHDWPDADAERLLERASALVRPGGRILIFEREPIELRGKRMPYVMASDLVFLHFLRPADLYLKKLTQLGFVSIQYRRVELDIGFHLIVARCPA
ncbi:MAG TPA: methyltransferase [Xanthobacteraceae bacterium]|nr:methyltransferase [Xanthobacteraceae bacterium]